MDDDSKENAEETSGFPPSEERGEPDGPPESGDPHTDAARARAYADRLTAEAARLEADLNTGSGPTPKAPVIGEPDALPLTFCRKCEVDVKPVGKGVCPRCRTFLRQNFIARKHPVNVLRRDQLHAENLAEYRPDTLHLRRACRWLANITERLENVKDGTPEHQRLVAMYTELVTTLEAARAAQPLREPTNYDQLTIEELADFSPHTQQRHVAQRKKKPEAVPRSRRMLQSTPPASPPPPSPRQHRQLRLHPPLPVAPTVTAPRPSAPRFVTTAVG